MSPRRIGVWSTGALWALFGCGNDARPPALSTAGQGNTESLAEGGADAAEAQQPEGGSAGSPPQESPAVCGNDIVEDQEDCEPSTFKDAACEEFGFESGTVSCSSDCQYDFDDCQGTEICHDGRDNDGDFDIDCEDEDCEDACATSCGAVAKLPDPFTGTGDNSARANELSGSCAAGEPGPELVYEVTAAETGMLDVTVDGGNFPELMVSMRTSCEDDESEVACGVTRTSVEVTAGDRMYVVVEGASLDDQGKFDIYVRSRPADVCGDGLWDPGEACEDGDMEDGDGCDSSCQVEAVDLEPNDGESDAVAFVDPFYGQVSPAGDVDWIRIDVPQDGAYAIVSARTLALGGCGTLADPELELLDESLSVIAQNDDYDGSCPRLLAENLSAGTYYAVVRESPNSIGERNEFPYELGVTVDWCGNNLRGPLEGCDDGNSADGDGCSADCRAE